MNTKFLRLLIMFLLISISSATGSVTTRSEISSKAITESGAPVSQNEFSNGEATTAPLHSPVNHAKKEVSHSHPEEDGKHHHIHFSRLTKSGKRRFLFLLAAKIVLLIVHLGMLAQGFYLLFH